jgi:hypothetical protein
VLAAVRFAACLFYAGLSTRPRPITTEAVVLGPGGVLFTFTLILVVTLPVTVTV